MSKRTQQFLKSVESIRKGRVSKEPVLPRDLDADVLPSDVRPEKVAKAKKLIARSNYPSKKIIRSVADKIARYF